MSEQAIEQGRKIAQIVESLPERERAILLAFSEGIAAAKTLAAQQEVKSA